MAGKRAIPGIPFSSAVGDSVDLMRKVWGMTGLPSIPSPGNLAQMAVRLPTQLPNMVAPTLDIGELDKRIAEMRAVEHWLQLNLSMLRATVQSLEVQRSTIATLKGIGGAMLSPVLRNRPGEEPSSEQPALPDPMAAFAQQMALLQAMQAMPAAALQGGAQAPAQTHPEPAAEPEPDESPEPEPEPKAAASGRRRSRKKAAAPRVQVPVPSTLNPVTWWNAVQDQFARIAATAAEPAPEAAEQNGADTKAAPRARAKSAGRKRAKTARKSAARSTRN